MRILVIENKRPVAERWAAQLKWLGHRVVGLARHGRDAVHSASSLEPELIIIGTQLPLIDGIETARAILAQRPVPLIVLTSYATADFVRRAREGGGHGLSGDTRGKLAVRPGHRPGIGPL